MSENNTTELSKGSATCVRFSPREYKRIKKKSDQSRKSIPQLLRDSYFGRLPTRVLLKDNDLDILRKDLNRIGNNLNQIARKLNAGLMHGWSNALESVSEQFETLTDQIHYDYGVPKR